MITTPSTHRPHPNSAAIPRWLHLLAVTPIVLLLSLAAILVLGFLSAGPEDNLAGVLLIFAVVIAVPACFAGLLWGAGACLGERSPVAARVLIIASIVISLLMLLSQATLWLAGV